MTIHEFPQRNEDAICMTPSIQDMLRVIEIVRENRENLRIGAIVGAPGIGKTTLLNWHHKANPDGSVYCCITPDKGDMKHALGSLAGAVAFHLRGCSGRVAFDAIVREIDPYAAPVVLIDEAQLLKDDALDAFRCLSDKARLPMVFAGNHSMRARITDDVSSSFAQFSSRIGARADIEATTPEDIEALARYKGIKDRKAVAWLCKKCAGVAGLRNAAKLIDTAKGLNKDAIELIHLTKAAEFLGMAK